VYSAQKPDLQTRIPRSLEVSLKLGVPALVAVACGWVAIRLVSATQFALVPMAVALLLTALLTPPVRWLHHRLHLPRYLAGALALVLTLALLAGILSYAIGVLVSDVGNITALAQDVLHTTAAWLREGPLHVQDGQLTQAVDQAQQWLARNSSNIASSAMALGGSVSQITAMTLLALVSTFFFLGDGPAIWRNLMWLVPPGARSRQYDASRRAWRSLELYARTAVAVAAIDALGIGLGAWVLKVPFPLPLAMLVFVSSFIPFIGAIASGAVAVVLALFTGGLTPALVMLGVVLAVQQIEGNVLQPLLMGKTVSLHPYAVIIGVSLAGYLWGLVGALLAVPVMAGTMAWLRYLNDDDRFPRLGTGGLRTDRDEHPEVPEGPSGHGGAHSAPSQG